MRTNELLLGAAACLLLIGSPAVASAQSVQGVDVSEFQGNIDWGAAKAAGIDFAFVRVSDGSYHDPLFQQNWNGTAAHGVVRGAYQFFRAGGDPIADADLLVNAVGTLGPGDLPPVADVEVMDGQSAGTLASHLSTWCSRIKARTGLTPIIYTAPGFWNPLGANFSGETLWVANWFVGSPGIPSGWGNYTFWQYNDNGHVAGIPALVDQDVFHGSLAQLLAYSHGSPPPGAGSGGVGGTGGSSGQPVLTLGARGSAVALLQRLLAAAGFNPGPADGDFGSNTLAAVKAFQQAHGLAVDGVVGPNTWAALSASGKSNPGGGGGGGSPTLQQGDTGSAVVTLQQLLAARGFSAGAADGVFGPKTAAAVRAFQASRHLTVDGVVGPQTWAALRSGGSAPPPAPAPSGGASQPTIQSGSTGPAVVACQIDLTKKGFSPGAEDGDFGPKTEAAVKAFQASRGLAADGIVGPLTWAALQR